MCDRQSTSPAPLLLALNELGNQTVIMVYDQQNQYHQSKNQFVIHIGFSTVMGKVNNELDCQFLEFNFNSFV